MFNLFSKNNDKIDRSRPDFNQDLVTEKEYSRILKLSLREVEKIGEVISVSDGTITISHPNNSEEEIKFHLDNLVRKCKSTEASEWEELIIDHYRRFTINESKAEYIYKDFDYAQDLLTVQVRSYDTFSESDIQDYVTRIDIPHTCTFLILDYDEGFHYVRRDDIAEWEKEESELFRIGLGNLSREEIDIQEYLIQDKFQMFAFFSGDYSASFMVELEKNADFVIGQLGSVVTIPTKGTALVHPINADTALDFISAIGKMQQGFYKEDPVPITDKFYWYYQHQFILFPEENEEDKVFIFYPKELSLLLKNNL